MITKSAENKTNFALNLIFTDSARSAWGHILAGFAAIEQPKVLLPSYIGFTEREGSGVFDPIVETTADYQFYKVDDSLRIDLDEFAHLLSSGGLNIALVIHYFGLCRNDMKEVKKLCIEHNVLLVEDCAHAFHLEVVQQKIGNYGDYSFYSLHKHLATESGGVLKINSNVIDLPPLQDKNQISQAVLGQYAKTQFGDIANARRNNFLSYKKFLPVIKNVEIMFDLIEEDIPQSFPIRVSNGLREKLYFYLIGHSIPVTALYYRLIDKLEKKQFPISFAISDEILNFPVHQDVTLEDIRIICSHVANFFNEMD